ncbi:hypothetical protein GCM10011575_31800 [Microlunatus endophyticus]|uniref:Uncharacterized protein n=1 Tax=Microlunatus endophyticus TaxID=1716077 RepID=A0A917SBV6_9ACTN|nr:hypothetical protein GCM10011575_31800 [Microlunatus endophyticus]
MITPLPVPEPPEPLTAMVTTAGSTLAATSDTWHAVGEVADPDDLVVIKLPTTPPTIPAINSAATDCATTRPRGHDVGVTGGLGPDDSTI